MLREQIAYTRRKQSKHKGRLALPDHLPVEEEHIYPEGNLEEMVCIGKEITEELECVPARCFIRRYIRYKYVAKDQQKEGVAIGCLPERVIDKGIPGSGLLACILVDKYMDHCVPRALHTIIMCKGAIQKMREGPQGKLTKIFLEQAAE